MRPADVQATFCATLVDEWIAGGVTHAVVAPGSRSTPVAIALAERGELALHVVHDERVAAFVALGLGLSGTPAVLLCTSGTAAANFLPAVVEAGLSAVPMLVVTADRPPELRDVGAPQTIDQRDLYGRAVRWFHDPGVADDAAVPSWRSLGRRSLAAAVDGPVHLNLPVREPLLGTTGALPPRHAIGPSETSGAPAASLPAGIVELLRRQRGVILAGGRSGVPRDEVAALAAATGWPVLADPLSGCRQLAGAVTSFDALLRDAGFAAAQRPDVVIRVGRPAASKVLAAWAGDSGATVVQVGGPGIVDPDHRVAVALPAAAATTLADAAAREARPEGSWSARWIDANERAEAAITDVLAGEPALTEPAVARTIATHLPAAAELVVASSMPVRDLEWFGGAAARAHANRGANGIDGVVSTALGVALGGPPTVALVGDLALLHDSGALTALRRRRADLRIVVVDNDGGGIFSFLPQARALDDGRFEQLFGTPHGTDLVGLAGAHGIDAATVTTADELAVAIARPGPSVTRILTERAANVLAHERLNAAVRAAISP